MPCYSPLKGYRDRQTNGLTFRKEQSSGTKMEVACGQCLGCRIDRSRMWAVRISHECSLYESGRGNSFITLTYNDDKVPYDGSLVKPHFQKFMKRLRKAVTPHRIRYFMCGEYGTCEDGTLGRPHYHAILFNQDFSRDELVHSDRGVHLYRSDFLDSLWVDPEDGESMGFASVGDANFQSAGYVARYCVKKVTGKLEDDFYWRVDPGTGEAFKIEPEYASMSTGRPCKEHKRVEPECDDCQGGIGGKFYEKWKGDFYPRDETPVGEGTVLPGTPRYYLERLRKADPELFEDIKERREGFRVRNAKEYTPERLMAKYKVKKAQVGTLRRQLK